MAALAGAAFALVVAAGLFFYLPQIARIKAFYRGVIEALKVIMLFELLLHNTANMIQEVQLQVLRINAITSNVAEDIFYLLISDAVHS